MSKNPYFNSQNFPFLTMGVTPTPKPVKPQLDYITAVILATLMLMLQPTPLVLNGSGFSPTSKERPLQLTVFQGKEASQLKPKINYQCIWLGVFPLCHATPAHMGGPTEGFGTDRGWRWSHRGTTEICCGSVWTRRGSRGSRPRKKKKNTAHFLLLSIESRNTTVKI